MAKSIGGKDLLLEKGEKIGLGIASLLGVLFLAFGIMAMLNRPQNPEEFSKNLEAKAADLNRKMGGESPPIEPVKPDLERPAVSTFVAYAPDKNNYFDPTAPPDSRRIAPTILAAREAQADMAVVKILANDFILERNETGDVTKVRVGVVTAKNPDEKVEGGRFIKDVMKGRRKGGIAGKRQPGAGGMPGGPGFGEGGGPGMGMPGMPGGRGGGSPGPGGGGFPGGGGGGGYPGGGGSPGGGFQGFPGGPGAGFGGGPGPGGGMQGFPGGPGPGMGGGVRGGMPGMGMGGFPGGGDLYGGSQQAGSRYEVTYVEGANDEEIERQMNGRRLAITIKPQRMAVIQASFPYREQLEKFRIALRYQDLKDLYAHPEDMPVFNGVDLQRKAYRPRNGGRDLDPLEDWQSIDLAGNTQDLRAVTIVYKEETPPDLQRVMLHEDHMLVMPLPAEMPGAGKYPDLRLKTLKDAMETQKKRDPKNVVVEPSKKRFQAGENPFKRETSTNANMYNPGGEGGFPGGLGSMFMGMGGKGKGKAGEGGLFTATVPQSYEPPDFVYVRVYDTDIKDGLVYAYRLRVKVKNPNYQRKGEVSKASDADNEELPPQEDHWLEVPQKVAVPQGGYHYVTEYTPPKANETRGVGSVSRPQEGQAVIQIQRWYEYLDLPGGLKEPVGDWVLADLLATRGMYVTGKAFTPLPFWSSVENRFVLREIPGEKTPKGKEARRGAVIEPVRPKALLAVDVQGGKVRPRVPQNPGDLKVPRGPTVEDESATEVLFQYPDGSLELRSSAYDKADADRKEREKHFQEWVDQTQQQNPSGPAPKKKDDF